MRYRFAWVIAVTAGTVVLPGAGVSPASAQTAQQWKCTGNPDIPWDQQIVGCTKAIQSGQFSGTRLNWAYYNRGNAYYNTRDFDRAIADYNRSIQLDPNNSSWDHNGRGLAWKAKGDLDRAIADFSEAIRLDPKHAKAYTNRGNAYEAKGDHDRALADYDQVKRLSR